MLILVAEVGKNGKPIKHEQSDCDSERNEKLLELQKDRDMLLGNLKQINHEQEEVKKEQNTRDQWMRDQFGKKLLI